MLTGSGFGNDAMLAHASGEQRLPECVVDFMRAGVQQVLTLQVDLGAPEQRAHTFGVIERRGAASVIRQQILEFFLK